MLFSAERNWKEHGVSDLVDDKKLRVLVVYCDSGVNSKKPLEMNRKYHSGNKKKEITC